jgi:hypothetical protein
VTGDGKLNIVFSELPDGVGEEEFNTWYDAHLAEILTIPGFVSARRYEMQPLVVGSEDAPNYRYLALYELRGDIDKIMAEMELRNLKTSDAYAKRKHAADEDPGPELPDWWSRVMFASWNCIPLGETVYGEE